MPVPPSSRGTSTCSTGSPVASRSRVTTSLRSQLEPTSPGKVETMISSTRSSWTACIAAVYGSGWAICPWASIPAPRSAESARRRRRSASGCPAICGSLCGHMIMKLAGERAARSLIFAISGSPSTVSFAITSTFASPPSSLRSTTTCSTGIEPATFSIRSTTWRRIHPERDSGCVETMMLVDRRLELGERVADGVHRVGLDDEPVGRDPGLAQLVERLVEPAPRRRPARVLVDDVPLARRVHGQTTVTWSAPRPLDRLGQRPPATVSFATTSR